MIIYSISCININNRYVYINLLVIIKLEIKVSENSR